MAWNLRAVRRPDGSLALYEVHCDRRGRATALAAAPATFSVDEEDGVEELRQRLTQALDAVERLPILDLGDIPGARG